MTESQVETWCDDFLEAMQSPPDWKRLQELFNKRCTVEMPGEPKAKKFEDWKKKAEPFLAGFKNAKRAMPKGTKPIIVQGKKDEVEVIFPEQCTFTWTKTLEEIYPNVSIASGEKTKIFIYNRVLLNSKSECSFYQAVFSPSDYKGADRAEDKDSLLDQIFESFTPANERFSEEIKVEFPVAGKMDKTQMFELFGKFGAVQRSMMKGCVPVNMSTGKDEVFEGVIPAVYNFKWSAALNEVFKLELADGADVQLTSFDCIKIKAGKVIAYAPHFDAENNIKPAGKSGAA